MSIKAKTVFQLIPVGPFKEKSKLKKKVNLRRRNDSSINRVISKKS